jgi:hypothetical protein
MKSVRHGLGVVCSCAIALLSNNVQAAPSITIQEQAKLSNNHVAINVKGAYECGLDPYGQPEVAYLVITVIQAAGKSTAFGVGALPTTPVCDGTQQQYSVVVLTQPGNPPFHGGPAQATAIVGFSSGPDLTFTQHISLTGGGN